MTKFSRCFSALVFALIGIGQNIGHQDLRAIITGLVCVHALIFMLELEGK